MGCATSKIENEEVVALCSTRKRHVKDAVSARHNFAAAFSNYVSALKTIGSAFSQFKEAEFRDSPTSTPVTATPMKAAQPPPLPPLYQLNPVKRTVSMPPLSFEAKKPAAKTSTENPPNATLKNTRSATLNKKKSKDASPTPSPEPERSEKTEKGVTQEERAEPLEEAKKQNSPKVENNVKVSSDDEDEASWEVQPPPPPVPSSKAPPPPPPPPSSSWMSNLFDFPQPLQRADDNEEEFENENRHKQQEQHQLEDEEEKRRKIQEEEKVAQREEEERRLKQQQDELELAKKQEQVHRQPSTVEEGEEGDEEEEEEQSEEVEESDEDAEEEEEVETEQLPPKAEKERVVSYDLPKSDLSIVTSSKSRRGSGELVAVLKRIVEPFEVAYESGRHVAAMLEAQRVSFHPNFIDGRSDETHAKKVLRAISWSSNNSALARAAAEQPVLDDDSGDTSGTNASTLDRLLAWEKKLYDEVKRAEGLRVELEKKNSWIQKEESRGGNAEAIEKAKAAEKMLHTRHVVAMQGVDTARNAVMRLRDAELYPQLLELLKGLYEMWKKTHECHEEQYKAVAEMKKLNTSDVMESTNSLHKVATEQLKVALSRWYQYFGSVVSSQRTFMQQLNVYVKVSVKSVELDKGIFHAASPKPISRLCHEWQLALDRLPDKSALESINTFVADLQLIVDMQREESRHRKKVESLEKEVKSREIYVAKYEKKHFRNASRTVTTDENGEVSVEVVPSTLSEKRAQLEVLKRRRDEEREKAEELGQRSKAKTISSLELGLPSIFYAARAFSKQCYEAHEQLQEFADSSLLMDK